MGTADPAALRDLARLARLALSEEELRRFAPELERILEAFQVLARHAPPGPPLAPELPAAWSRADEPLPSLAREALLASASTSEDGFFAVPKTVGGER